MKLIRFDEQFTARLSAIDETPWPALRFIMLQDLRRLTEETLTSQQRTSYFIELNMRLGKVFRQWARKDTLPALDPELFIQACRQITDWPDTDTKLWLETAICLGLIRLGAIDKLIEFLREQYSVHIDQEVVPASQLQDGKWLDQLDGKIPAALLDQLRKYDDLPQFKSSHRTVNGLFVLQSGEYSVGAIAEISLEKVTVSDKLAIDRVRIATHLVDESDVISQQTRAVCIYLREKYHKRNEGRLRLEYSLNQPSSLLVGGSAGLAFALLGQMGLYAYQHNHTFEPRVYQDVAFTGTIDEKGNVLPVSASSFKDKIEAAFFGNIRMIVVPKSQEQIAEESLKELQNEYPNRKIEILPVATINDLNQRPDVIQYQRRKITSRLNQFIHDYANSVTLIILGFIVLAAAWFWFGVVKNSVPVAIKDVEINHIHHAEVKNRYGYTIWKMDDYSNATLSDLDEDGSKEILVGYARIVVSEKRGYLFCYNQDFSLRWKKKLSHDVKYGDMEYSDFFSVQFMTIDDFNSDGEKEICVKISHNYFPKCYMVLSSSGKILSQYWHSGDLTDIGVIDLIPDNGTKELLLAGENNEYKCGVLVILNPFKMYGTSPQCNPYYTKEGAQTGGELAYLRFSTTHFQDDQYRDKARLLGINLDDIIRLGLFNWPQSHLGEWGDLVVYHLNKELQPIFIDLTDFYYSAYEEQFPDKPKLKYNDPKLIDHFRKILYWNGSTWSFMDPLLDAEK